MLVYMGKINFITHFFLNILQRKSNLIILGNIGVPGHTPKTIVSIWRKPHCLNVGKNSTSSFRFSLRCWKDLILQTCNFGYFGHTWLCTLKMIMSTYRKLPCLFRGRKSTSSPTFFCKYWKDTRHFYLGC